MNPVPSTTAERLRLITSAEALLQMRARVEDLADPDFRASAGLMQSAKRWVAVGKRRS
jgi:hypothetical protein